ncbi:hypothetical protein BU26DRAFT_524208 [Trematosphaeria pertusa]|uniref:Uncharacterized protein n=1 Tax=Trematosphaeria pertusa TaxID=390896 RepID=A0A6A6HZ42_9PLEO|nr:uncharacterized protein BU26DRAFT_524208 [Trematosphaeria pertusa]KAF2242610.1 hypothetical protein BU26DRAFT_524208 [Trematosphaeria pertusa]
MTLARGGEGFLAWRDPALWRELERIGYVVENIPAYLRGDPPRMADPELISRINRYAREIHGHSLLTPDGHVAAASFSAAEAETRPSTPSPEDGFPEFGPFSRKGIQYFANLGFKPNEETSTQRAIGQARGRKGAQFKASQTASKPSDHVFKKPALPAHRAALDPQGRKRADDDDVQEISPPPIPPTQRATLDRRARIRAYGDDVEEIRPPPAPRPQHATLDPRSRSLQGFGPPSVLPTHRAPLDLRGRKRAYDDDVQEISAPLPHKILRTSNREVIDAPSARRSDESIQRVHETLRATNLEVIDAPSARRSGESIQRVHNNPLIRRSGESVQNNPAVLPSTLRNLQPEIGIFQRPARSGESIQRAHNNPVVIPSIVRNLQPEFSTDQRPALTEDPRLLLHGDDVDLWSRAGPRGYSQLYESGYANTYMDSDMRKGVDLWSFYNQKELEYDLRYRFQK